MGNFYDKPKREGNSPYTRSGVPPPKMTLKSGSESPSHRVHDPMSLELHMADERVRASGLTPAEREWRRNYLKGQQLHPDEPIHVDAVHRQLNPIRVLYRYPLDKLYVRFLRPTFGTLYGSVIRVIVPKAIIIFLTFETLYYLWKYEDKNWQKKSGVGTFPKKFFVEHQDKIEANNKGIMDIGLPNPAKYLYDHPSYQKRLGMLDIGETQRPW